MNTYCENSKKVEKTKTKNVKYYEAYEHAF